jgi:Ca-activated chloride channel homolog
MGGRHRPAKAPELQQLGSYTRERDRRGLRSRLLIALVVLVAVAIGTGATALERAGLLGCLGSRTKLTIMAAPDVAPALKRIERRFEQGRLGSNGRCADVSVTVREPWHVTSQLVATRAPGGPTGPASSGSSASSGSLGAGSPSPNRSPRSPVSFAEPLPDIWVPDSTAWLARATAGASPGSPVEDAVSIAHSPAVIAMPKPVAQRLGQSRSGPRWRDMIRGVAGQPPLRVQVADPTRSAASLAALAALREATVGQGGDITVIAALHRLSATAAPSNNRLLKRLSGGAAARAGPQAFPYTEQGVWRYNRSGPPVPLVAVYVRDGSAVLDYPYVTLLPRQTQGAKRNAARNFLAAIQELGGRQILQDQAFRTVTDEAGPALSPLNGLRFEKPPSAFVPSPGAVGRVIRLWSVLNNPARLLSVFDVSGSMLKVDPPAKRSRIVLTREATARGFSLLSKDSDVGLWVFSTDLTATTDYRQLLEVGRMGDKNGDVVHGDRLKALLGSLAAKRGGATGLYDTTLAAYRKMTGLYDPRKFNAVILFTDGRNEDRASISLEKLLTELRRLHDPKRPVTIFALGYGTEIDEPALRAIAAATGGRSFVSTDPASVFQVFFEGMAQRACEPADCG